MSRGQTNGFDRNITVFSPAGHLFQVEYAFKAVNHAGITAIAIKGKDYAVVVSQKKIPDKFVIPKSCERVFTVSKNIGCAMVGRLADCKSQVQRAQILSCDWSYNYGSPIAVDQLCCKIADIAHRATQTASLRPLACTMLIIGYDEENGPMVYKTDPAGYFGGFKAVVAGEKQIDATKYIEKRFKSDNDFSIDEAIKLSINALVAAVHVRFKPEHISIGYITSDNREFRYKNLDQVEAYLTMVHEQG